MPKYLGFHALTFFNEIQILMKFDLKKVSFANLILQAHFYETHQYTHVYLLDRNWRCD